MSDEYFDLHFLQYTDIDECKTQTADCALNATCSDTDGGYTCTCKSGFEENGKMCTGDDRIIYTCIIMVANITLLSLSILSVVMVVHLTMTQCFSFQRITR